MTRRTGSASLLPVLLSCVVVACPASAATPRSTGAASALTDDAHCGHGWDYGDAPLPYPTTRAQHGPRHLITVVGALTIGTSVTAETNGRPGGGDVDDGLATPVRVPVDAPQTRVRVRNRSGSTALLVGWLDATGDGFRASGRAVARVPVGTTHVTLRWTRPAGVPAGVGAMRLRLYPGRPADPVPTGVAAGGEVEDYRVTLVGAAPQPTPTGPTPRPTSTGPTPQPTPTGPTPTTGVPQPAPSTPTPTPTAAPAGPTTRVTSTPTAPGPSTPAPTSTPPNRPASAAARSGPPHRRPGVPLAWSVALLIVAPAAAGAAHAVGRAARRSR